jgi:hypothetical protein
VNYLNPKILPPEVKGELLVELVFSPEKDCRKKVDERVLFTVEEKGDESIVRFYVLHWDRKAKPMRRQVSSFSFRSTYPDVRFYQAKAKSVGEHKERRKEIQQFVQKVISVWGDHEDSKGNLYQFSLIATPEVMTEVKEDVLSAFFPYFEFEPGGVCHRPGWMLDLTYKHPELFTPDYNIRVPGYQFGASATPSKLSVPVIRLSKKDWLRQHYPELSELPKWRFPVQQCPQ